MLLRCVLIDALLVGSTVSLTRCADGGADIAYISEFILLCKRDVHTRFIPWLCVAAFACVVFVQLWWMHRVSAAWFRESGAAKTEAPKTGSERLFLFSAAASVAGFLCVVQFDWRDTSSAHISAHRAGVAALSLGSFVALHLIWANLRAAASNVLLQHARLAEVPCVAWAEYDVLFVCVLAVFMVTSLLGTSRVVSVVCEYVAFAMLFVQTTWLFLVCLEREHGRRVGEVSGTGLDFTQLLALLLTAYGVEAVLVFAAGMLAGG